MFSSNKKTRKCATCQYWVLEHREDLNHGYLGECRRFPPSRFSTITVLTESADEIYSLQWKALEEKQSESEKKWEENRMNHLRKAEVRLQNIQETLQTCPEASKGHWERKAELQEQLIARISLQTYNEKDAPYMPMPQEPGFKAVKGQWSLTSGEDFCGEWKER
jgi:hypothetical protein